jgi:hypothetical protein
MTMDPDQLAGNITTENTGGLLTGFLAEENVFDRRTLLRIGTWGATAVGAVIAALYANETSIGFRREQVAAADLARQSQQIQSLVKESQNETRRLASAIDTLNSDRDRLYSRVTVLEQGLDSVTGAIAHPTPGAAAPQTTPAASTKLEPPPAVQSPPPAHPASPVASTASKPGTGASAPQDAAAAALPAMASVPATMEPASSSPSPPQAQQVSPVASTAAKPGTGATTRQDAAPLQPQAEAKAKASAPAAEQALPPQSPAASLPAPVVGTKAAKPTEKLSKEAASEPATATVASVGHVAPITPVVTPAIPLMPPKSIMAPPDAAASRLIEPEKPPFTKAPPPAPDVVASIPSADEPDPSEAATPPELPVKRTEFGVDLGRANTIGGLRALWRGLRRSNSGLATLDPIIVVKENSSGKGMQLRLVAGPLDDVTAAAKICAALTESRRSCEPTVFDGQSLDMSAEEPAAAAKPVSHKRARSKRVEHTEEPKKSGISALSTFFGRR